MQYVPSVEREYPGLQRQLKLPTCAVCAISGERVSRVTETLEAAVSVGAPTVQTDATLFTLIDVCNKNFNSVIIIRVQNNFGPIVQDE